MIRKQFFLIILLIVCRLGASQVPDTANVIHVPAKIVDGDTIIITSLKEVTIGNSSPQFDNRWEEKKYWKLVYNLKKVYPYAKLARTKFEEMNQHFLTLKSEREKKEYAKKVENEIREQFEEQLKSLTITQGRLLIKLIYRETGNTSYELVKELRGSMSAVFWQTLARIFGSNLKTKYDPVGEDQIIESILVSIESGLI